jgi:hypothetical protein
MIFLNLCLGLEASVNSVDGFYWKHKDNIATVVVAVGGDQICVWLRESIDGIVLNLFYHLLFVLIFNVLQENGGFYKNFHQNQF